MIDDTIIIVISKYTIFNEYKNISQINKIINKSLLNDIPYHIKKEYAIKNLKEFPYKLLELFDPIKLYKTPVYKIINQDDRDYIDYIKISNFNENNNFIRGIDKYNRPFISFLFDKQTKKVGTLFQRYTFDKYRWVTGGSTPFGGYTIIYDFDNFYKETAENRYLINFFNNN